MDKYFPFGLGDDNSVSALIEDEPLYPLYSELFEKYDYSGNGYCWEGHIIQVLETLDSELLKHISFDPEAGAFFAYADSEPMQIKFATLLSPIFSDTTELEKWIKKADRSRIDD